MSRPRLGGQSMFCSSRGRRQRPALHDRWSRPVELGLARDEDTNSISPQRMDGRGDADQTRQVGALLHDLADRPSVGEDVVDLGTSAWCGIPKAVLALPWGRVDDENGAAGLGRAAATFTVVVVLPAPPFWLATVGIRCVGDEAQFGRST